MTGLFQRFTKLRNGRDREISHKEETMKDETSQLESEDAL